jgi:hypothetical protein
LLLFSTPSLTLKMTASLLDVFLTSRHRLPSHALPPMTARRLAASTVQRYHLLPFLSPRFPSCAFFLARDCSLSTSRTTNSLAWAHHLRYTTLDISGHVNTTKCQGCVRNRMS